MKKRIAVVLSVLVLGTHNLMAETCVSENYTVSYSCGDGTATGTLPSNQVATFGSDFTPVLLNTNHCTPPSGKVIDGIEIWLDDAYNGAFSRTAAKFTYYYASNIVIKPRYIGTADINTLWALRGLNGVSYTYNTSERTWQTVFPYGIVSGIAACSNVKPKSSVAGWNAGVVAEDQNAITEESGLVCYCKMTEPTADASPWVLANIYANASTCSANCALNCGNCARISAVFRASAFSGTRP